MADTASRQATVAATQRRSSARAVRRSAGGAGRSTDALSVLGVRGGNAAVSELLGGGRPLPPDIRQDMEARFGADFQNVRIHDDTQAHASAAALHAKAYTHGHDIVFSANRFAPQAGAGKRLLAHELAHVVQQRRGGARPTLDGGAPHEHAADAAADAVAGGQATVSVAGATGVGVARDEEEGWGARLRRKYRETREKIPPEYREKMQQAADFAADKAVTVAALPFGPAAAYAADGLGSSLLHGAQKSVAGEEGAADDLKNFGRDKVQEGLGAAKGVATQVTEVVDTAMWVGNEYKGLRDKAAEKIGGKEGSAGNTIVKQAINATVRVMPGMSALPDLADASDAAKSVGLVDPDTKQASITAPMSIKLNEWAKSAEQGLGATVREEEMFTPMDKAELASNISTQVVLAFTGATEVKVAMNVVGALGGLRGIVESIRNEKDWQTSSRFWGSLIGMGLSIVGLKHTMAATKITTLLLKYGWVAAAIPPLKQMAADYYYLETHPELTKEERRQVEARIKHGWTAAIHVIKDAILHVSQTQGGSAAKKPGGADEGTPAAKPAAKPAAEAGDTGAAVPKAQPAVKADAAPVTPEPASGPTPIGSGKGKPPSAANKVLAENLAKQAADKAGTVTRLPVRKAGATPPTEPAQQKVPVVAEVADKVAVGQTHGADGGGIATGGKPKLSVVGGKTAQPAVATLKPPGGKVSVGTGGHATGSTTFTSPGAPAKSGGGKAAVNTKPQPKASTSPKKSTAPKASASAKTASPPTKATAIASIESRLNALDVPPAKRAAFDRAADVVRKVAAKDPAAADRLLQGLEGRFAPSTSSQVAQDLAEVQKKLYPEKGADNKYRQSVAADERAQLEQARPGGKTVLKARVRESERLGVMGGMEKAAAEGIAVKDWDTPQQYKGEFGRGPDAVGARGKKRQMLEFKGGSSSLGKSKGVVEMSNEWTGRKIAELEMVGDKATAAELRKAALDGDLQGVVYRTRQLKAGEKTSRLKGHQLRDHLKNEKITPSGLIEYSPTKVERAYQARLKELKQAEADKNLRGLKNL